MQAATGPPLFLKSVFRYFGFSQMYVPFYKMVTLEICVLGSQSKPATDCVFDCVGELPNFGECKKLKLFRCDENKFTGITF